MKKLFRLFITAVLTLVIAACQQAPALPAESSEAEVVIEEAQPAPVVISADNAGLLSAVYSASVSSGFAHVTWAADSSAYWIEDNEQAALYDAESNELLGEFAPGEYTAIYDVSPDGNTVAYTQDGAEIHFYDLSSEADALTITPGFPYRNGFFNNDGSQFAVPSEMDLKIVLFNTSSGAEMGSLRGFETAAPVYSALFGDDDSTLLWFSRGTVQPMELASGNMGPTLSHEDFVTALRVSGNGEVVATTAAGMVGGEYSPVLTMWDAESGEILRQIAIPAYFSSISFSPDSTLIAAGTENSLLVFTVPTGDEVFRMDSEEVVSSVAFSPNGTMLAACGNFGTLTMYAVE
jgi:WD40 repeat protein